jgi:hypothetical protein
VGGDSFADITDAEVVSFTGGVTFDGELTPEQGAAIYDRMTSRDDADQAARADLRAKRDAVVAAPTLENVAALAVAHANYRLGE